MAEELIEPALAPFPTVWNFPFQPLAGSQTSKFTAGLVTAATRQKAGRLAIGDPSPTASDGPATSSALRIVVSGSINAARLAQSWCDCARTGVAAVNAADSVPASTPAIEAPARTRRSVTARLLSSSSSESLIRAGHIPILDS